MEWFRENWVFILFFAIFIVIHLFGHGMHGGGCGGHGDNKGEGEHKGQPGKGSLENDEQKGRRECC